ncbi:uncharacterized protein L203_104396 [Cryptococcus depauperatus CBS 7841]|uniref:Alpha N-terminal protein methyltransferase 1 n=1 Tax=Cryptococcus depauperatus CBS 7841 TaxID=1295531 RepID=A0AAJ8JVE2_9TREE
MIEVPDFKRRKPNSVVGSALKKVRKPAPDPNYEKGLEYWDGIEASVDGVLGGFGTGPVPHIEQLSSRLLLLSMLPSLSPFSNPLCPSIAPLTPPAHRRVALDVGAGIGRVTRNVLIPLFDDVVLVEPVEKFVGEAYRSAVSGEWRDLPIHDLPPKPSTKTELEMWKELKRRSDEAKIGRGKRVKFIKRELQSLNPKSPAVGGKEIGLVGEKRGGYGGFDGEDVRYDVIWCQWCLGHMNHLDLVTFLRHAKAALRDDCETFIFVKENCCNDAPGGVAHEFIDEETSSLTRSTAKWLQVFADAGLEVVKEVVQEGMPEYLYVIKA